MPRIFSESGGTGGTGSASDYLSVLTSAEISITTTANATIGRQHVISGTSANYTVTLPAASGNTGKFLSFRIANDTTKLFTLDGNGSETIDGSLTRVMWNSEVAILYCDGSNWFKIGGKSRAMLCQISKASQSISNSTITDIDFDTTDVDNSGLMADLTNNKILIPRAGEYFINIGGAIDSSSAARNLLEPKITGVAFYNVETTSNVGGTFPSFFGGRYTVGALAITDYITGIVYQDTAGVGSKNLTLVALSAEEKDPW